MICPTCQKKNLENSLIKKDNTFVCCLNHSFDHSKEGYLNLLISKSNSGDNLSLVNARYNFLNQGYYDPLALLLVSIIKNLNIKAILDCGCGCGYYTKILNANFNALGIDISKNAIKKAQKNDKNNLYLVASNYLIPFETNFFDCLLYIFSPIEENEAKRVLKSNSYLICVSPCADHLIELKKALYEDFFTKEKTNDFSSNFKLENEEEISFKMRLNNTSLIDLFMMTPYFYTTKKISIDKLKKMLFLEVTASFKISIYKKLDLR